VALHEQCVGKTDEWYTPPHVFDALGCMFDYDVAHPGLPKADWIPARHNITKGCVAQEWYGFIWMNPPFGTRNGLVPWLDKFVCHANGICLVPDRTSAPWWQIFAPRMDLILFVTPKIKFIGADGRAGKSPAQGTCLMSIGRQGNEALRRAEGKLGFLACRATAA
jgi:hypothetical protein